MIVRFVGVAEMPLSIQLNAQRVTSYMVLDSTLLITQGIVMVAPRSC